MASTFNLNAPRQPYFSDATTFEPAPWNNFTRVSREADGPCVLPCLRALPSHPISAEERNESQPIRPPTPMPGYTALPRPSPELERVWGRVPNISTTGSIRDDSARYPSPLSHSSPARSTIDHSLHQPSLPERAITPEQTTNPRWEPSPKRPIGTIYDPTLSRTPSPEARTERWVGELPSINPDHTHLQDRSTANLSRVCSIAREPLPSATSEAEAVVAEDFAKPEHAGEHPGELHSPSQSTPPSPPSPTHLEVSTSMTEADEDDFRAGPRRTGAIRARYAPIRSERLRKGSGHADEHGGEESGCEGCKRREEKWGRWGAKWWIWALVAFVGCWVMFGIGGWWGLKRGEGFCKPDGG